ncbi:MAG: ABC transporter permease [Micrococcus sp.]|nr:ABC transporter permease [Micrococcus sp.]
MSTAATTPAQPPQTATHPAPPTTPAQHTTTALGRLLAYTRRDFLRILRMVDSTFFVIVLPAALYLMFGAMSDWGSNTAGHGNVTAYTMSAMALYGAVLATTSIAGSAAVERQMGWGRQLSLTAFSARDYIVSKTLVAVSVAVLPTVLVLALGAATGATYADFWRWFATGALIVLSAAPFALYGLAAALVFRSEAAVSAASGILVVLAFLGNLFVPLSGVMLDIGRFTPLFGASTLVRWPQAEGAMASMGPGEPPVQLELWEPILNLGAWTVIFGVICLLAARRRTSRA